MPRHRRAPARFMERDGGDYAAGARAPGGFCFAEDTVLLSTHAGTHVDALAHTWQGDTLYNGHPAASVRSTAGAQRCGADKLAPVVTRGVLLDLAGDTPLDAGTPVGPAELQAACARAGIEPRPADAVLLRTGWWERHRDSPEGYFEGEPGLSRAGAEWLAATDPALVGADNYAVERLPSGEEEPFPVHLVLLHRHGIPLAENLDVAELAATGRATFLLVVAPLPLLGSLGSPVTPVAIL
jgi:kynurenine formamidase